MEVDSVDCDNFVSTFCEEDHSGSIDDEFYFETDFLALKGNPDYLKLMKTLAILQAQRIKVCQNIDKLEELKLKAMYDPHAVKEEILKSKAPYLSRCEIEQVPEIDWSKYKTLNGKNLLTTRRMAKLRLRAESNNPSPKKENHIKVRGRVYDEEKPENFNQLWTAEEQLRLEALLVEFPEEPIENRRWRKIAEALGNRTTQQVCSRVQKYFKKLHKAGLSAPSSSKHFKSQRVKHVHKSNKHLLYKPTTFFPGVSMPELRESDEDSSSSNDAALTHWQDILNMVKEEKTNSDGSVEVQHYGYKCIKCLETPIIGTRWECTQCPSVSICSDCIVELLDNPFHPLSHNFKPKKVFVNPSYRTTEFSTNNYLDPNFIS